MLDATFPWTRSVVKQPAHENARSDEAFRIDLEPMANEGHGAGAVGPWDLCETSPSDGLLMFMHKYVSMTGKDCCMVVFLPLVNRF